MSSVDISRAGSHNEARPASEEGKMARTPNIPALLKTIERFTRDVPIDPTSKKYKEWRKNQKEALTACQKVLGVWSDLHDTILPVIKLPCSGRVLIRQPVLYALPCRTTLLTRQPLSEVITIDKVRLTEAILDQVKPGPKKT
jgi:hypothetical protein